MSAHTRDEIENAFQRYQQAAAEGGRTGDWTAWADCFTDDVHYVEHHYGEIHGRAALTLLRAINSCSSVSHLLLDK